MRKYKPRLYGYLDRTTVNRQLYDARMMRLVCVGFRQFGSDIDMMIGHRPNCYWVVCWVALTPLVVTVRYVRCLLILHYYRRLVI